jgi:hypothetical protein
MTTQRRSYTNLMTKPAMGLYDERGRLVATVRADTPHDARSIFKRHGLSGSRVRRITPANKMNND